MGDPIYRRIPTWILIVGKYFYSRLFGATVITDKPSSNFTIAGTQEARPCIARCGVLFSGVVDEDSNLQPKADRVRLCRRTEVGAAFFNDAMFLFHLKKPCNCSLTHLALW